MPPPVRPRIQLTQITINSELTNFVQGTYLQFDDTSLAYLNDPAQRAEIVARTAGPIHTTQRIRALENPGDCLSDQQVFLDPTEGMR